MTYKQDDYFCWIESAIGSIRLQHHKGIVEAVDDGRVAWAKGKHISVVLEWIKKIETHTELIKCLDEVIIKRDQERQILWDVEKRQIMETLQREWEDKTNDDVN